MRPIWKGAISFGMVTIPVRLYTATQEKDVRFRLLHRDDHAPVVEKRFCSVEDKEVGWDDLVRGFEVSKGNFVVVDPKEIEEVKPESANTIDIGDFVDLEEIDPIYFEKSYFLEPDNVGAKPFSLLKRALEETARIAICRVTIRSKERLATIRAYDGTLVLETMYWPDEIRGTGGLDLPEGGESKVSSRELQMARALVENLSAKFRPEEYTDRYRIALQELIERKMSGERRNEKRRKPEPKLVDLMEALEASVRASKAAKAGPESDAGGKKARPSGSATAKTRARKRSAA